VSGTPPPSPLPPRPGDIILVRAIAWWDSGQLKRAAAGIALAALPLLWDLVERNALTWRSALMALIGGLFGWMGVKRAKAPDIVTGIPSFDAANVAARMEPPAGPKGEGGQ
jgi:hypothetical protein